SLVQRHARPQLQARRRYVERNRQPGLRRPADDGQALRSCPHVHHAPAAGRCKGPQGIRPGSITINRAARQRAAHLVSNERPLTERVLTMTQYIGQITVIIDAADESIAESCLSDLAQTIEDESDAVVFADHNGDVENYEEIQRECQSSLASGPAPCL